MKGFLQKLLFFLIPIVSAIGFIELKLSDLPNGYTVKRHLFESKIDSIQVLVLGSSEAYKDIQPGCFRCLGFNLAYLAQTPDYDKAITLRYLDRMPKLKVVLIILNPISFFLKLSNTPENWRQFYYHRFWGIRSADFRFYDPKALSLIALYSWPEVRGMLKEGFHASSEISGDEIDSLGGVKKNWLGKGREKEKMPIRLITGTLNELQYSENLRQYDILIDSLQSRHVYVFIVSAPVSTEMKTYLSDTNFFSRSILTHYREGVEFLKKKYRCSYYDYTYDLRFDADDFNDETHLGYAGGLKFSHFLDREIIRKSCFIDSGRVGQILNN